MFCSLWVGNSTQFVRLKDSSISLSMMAFPSSCLLMCTLRSPTMICSPVVLIFFSMYAANSLAKLQNTGVCWPIDNSQQDIVSIKIKAEIHTFHCFKGVRGVYFYVQIGPID